MSRTVRKYKTRVYWDKDSRSRKMSSGCLNHGSCSYCQSNRTVSSLRQLQATQQEYQ